jgi:multidrug resistance efflux pump
MPLEPFLRSRLARLALACFLILLSVWAFFPYILYRVASSAFINANLIRVNAPIAGRLAQAIPPRGSYFDAPVTLNLIDALSPNRGNLHELERQFSLAKESSALARRQLQEISASDLELARRIEVYREARTKRLDSEIAQTLAETVGCAAELKQRRAVGSRLEELTKSGIASEVRSAEALATQEAASARCAVAEARLDGLRVELTAAQNGLFVRDGANDVPYSHQQRDRLALRRQELETQAMREDVAAAGLIKAISDESDRMSSSTQYQIVLPAEHVVWSVEASPGSAVSEGQTIMSLADCAHRFVVVELPERNFEMITIGNKAAVRLIGHTGWQEGLVQRVRGSVARPEGRLLAAQMPAAPLGMITIELRLPSFDFTSGQTYCDIGRLAEVRFERNLPRFMFAIAEAWQNGVWLQPSDKKGPQGATQ